MISPLFTTIVLVCGFIWIYMKITSQNIGKGTRDFLDRENIANGVRRQSLDNLDYITFAESDYKVVNPAPNSHIEALYETLDSLLAYKIVNLTGISNTDLKMTYGPANLQDLTDYDQNYTKLARSIYDLGVEFEALGLISEAVKVYNFGIDIGTDISGNYIALANIYVSEGNFDEINRLIECADSIRSLTKNSTIKKLQEILDTHTTVVIAHNNSNPTDSPDSILPADILDILETVPYKSDDQNS